MTQSTICFIYRSANNNVSARRIVVKLDAEDRYEAWCTTSNDTRTFLKSRIIEFVDDIELPEVGSRIAELQALYPLQVASSRERWMNRKEQPEVCFTGFKKDEKSRLTDLAKSNGLFVRDGVSSNLSFLIWGETAGPSKMKQARDQGVVLLTRSAFLHLVETGEILLE